MVPHAERESFTYMTLEGHTLSAWITRRQWRYIRNLRNSASIRTVRRTLGAPFRKQTGRG